METNTLTQNPTPSPFVSVNWHVWSYCNYNCVFCFAQFKNVKQQPKKYLNPEEGKHLLRLLKNAGMTKITFVGGEPLLCPYITEYLKYSKQLGIITTIVTNGSRLTPEFIKKNWKYLDWVGLSIDSTSDLVEKQLGRGNGNHIAHIKKIVPKLREYGIKIKINITVTKKILTEDLHNLLLELKPDRIKGFQVLEIEEENSEMIDDLLITREEFTEFRKKHEDLNIVWETNDLMTSSYIMIDPLGRFFDNTTHKLRYSRSILEAGVEQAFQDIEFDFNKLQQRNGLYFIENKAKEEIA